MFLYFFLIAESLLSFAFDLDRTNPKTENIIYSPFSIATTLGMVEAGAQHNTRKEIDKVLHYQGTQTNLAKGFKELLSSVMAHANGYPNLTLNLENILWMQKEYEFLPLYQSIVVKDFYGDLREVDFKEPDRAVKEMNEWFLRKTAGYLGPLFTTQEITTQTKLVAASTLFLKAYFEKPFEPSHTRKKKFRVAEGKEIPVQMMYQKNVLPFYQGEGYRVVELNYLPLEKEFALWIVLPEGAVPTLSEKEFSAIGENLKPEWMELELPRFRLESALNLIPLLKRLGIKLAFTPRADFSRISEANHLMLSDFKHRALLVVEEGGTLAAAASSATFTIKALPPHQTEIKFIADHPFLFFIVDKNNNLPLFIGQVIEPKVFETLQF